MTTGRPRFFSNPKDVTFTLELSDYQKLQRIAVEHGQSGISAVVRQAIRQYIKNQ